VNDRFVVDTSALLAAAFAEPERDAVLTLLSEADRVATSAACLLQAHIPHPAAPFLMSFPRAH